MDVSYLLALQGLREALGPVVEEMFVILSSGLLVVAFAIALLIYWLVDKRQGTYLLFSYSAGSVINQTIKNTFCVYRPWIRDARITPSASAMASATDYSFPSGHTQTAVSVFGGLAWLQRHERRGVAVAGVIACVVVAFSRNYLGVHTPQDVLVAALVGIAGLWVADRTLAWVDAKPARDVVVLLAGLVVGLAFVLYITLKSYPTDYVNGELLVDPAKMTASGYQVFGVYSGCLLGWFAERRLVNFDVRADRRERTLRVVASVVFAGVGYLVLGALGGALVGEAGRKFAGVFAAMLAALWLGPWAARQASRRRR